MKICYDMIEGMYLTTNGNIKKGNHIYTISPTVCKHCDEEFLVCAGRVSDYCSRSCTASATTIGRHHSKETKAKLRECHTGDKNCMHGRKGPLSATYKPEKTDEEREIGRNYNAYYEWRKKVYERDDYTCMSCGNRGVPLNAHHVESYADNVELRTSLFNGITLCKTCHKNFHHQYGNGKNNVDQFIEFLNMEKKNGR